jgi:D-alanyl-D-alanine dipeptidase
MHPFGQLADLRAKPIPDQTRARAHRQGFRDKIAIDRQATAFAEPLVDLRARGIAGENYYFTARNPPYWRAICGAIAGLYARQSVAAKLVRINETLVDAGLELYVFDAYRPRAVQAYFHDVWMPGELKRHRLELSGEALNAEVERYWAAPTDDPARPAPHETGAALDLTLRWIGGEALWMGSLFDDVTEIAHRDRFEREVDQDFGLLFSDAEARANRRLLHWVMAEEGFAGHPDEWWHFSWGDQLWAALTGAAAAHYGLAEKGE